MNMRFFVRRKIDNEYRISLPSKLLGEIGLKRADLVDIFVTEDGHLLLKFGHRKDEDNDDGN